MTITQEQMSLLSSLRSERICGVDASVVQTIKGAVINGQETRLAALFKSPKNALDDKRDIVASYVIMSPEDVIIL